MNYLEDAELAANYLKQAIPKMVGNHIPANPINYTLWYNYVSDKTPSLNRNLDRLIRANGTCTREQSEELYFRFVIGEYLEEHNKSLENLTLLASHFLEHIGTSIAGSAEFDSHLADNIAQLKQAKTTNDVTTIISDVINTTESIRDTNNVFSQQLGFANQEILSLRRKLQEVEQHVFVDKLTQIFNRHAFDIQLKKQLDAESTAEKVCLIIADIDHFKAFNDQYGHIIGDKVLSLIAKLISKLCPENALATRYGGEEFAIIVSDSSEQEAAKIAEVLRSNAEKMRVTTKSSNKTLDNISLSFGVARYQRGESMEDFIDRADKMLYRAKHNGRNRVEVETVESQNSSLVLLEESL